VAFDEKAFFSERPESRPAKYPCPRCKRTNEYTIRWMRRTKKDRPPQGTDERDRAKYAKLRDHLLRLDDEVTCKTCGKKFEIPSLHSLLFVDQLEGLPKDVEDEETGAGNREPGTGSGEADAQKPLDAAAKAKLPARFTRPTRGWRG
jgi:hypothetical protein